MSGQFLVALGSLQMAFIAIRNVFVHVKCNADMLICQICFDIVKWQRILITR